MRSLCTLIAILAAHYSLSQEIPPSPPDQFGKITAKTLQADFQDYAEFGAVVIFDYGQSEFYNAQGNLRLRFTRTTRIKILDQSKSDLANHKIFLYQGDDGNAEVVSHLEGRAYNLEGTKVIESKLDSKTAFTEKASRHWKIVKFAIPNVREGSIIEYHYQIESPYEFNLVDWNFQREIPTLHSEYRVAMGPFYEYVSLLRGADKFDIYQSFEKKGLTRMFAAIDFHEVVHRYVMKSVPAFVDESFITTPADYLLKLDFQLSQINYPNGTKLKIISTWPMLAQAFLKHERFGKFLHNCSRFAKLYLREHSSLLDEDPLKTMQNLVHHVRHNTHFDGTFHRYSTQKSKDFVLSKTGNSTEINLWLIALLREANIDANPILISTRTHGKIHREYPFERLFNSTLVMGKVGGRALILDGTDRYLAFTEIPTDCINGDGLVLDRKEPQWIDLSQTRLVMSERKVNLAWSESSLLRGTSHFRMTGQEARFFKRAFADDKQALTDHLEGQGFFNVKNVKSEHFNDSERPYSLSFDFESSVNAINEKIYLNPFLNQSYSESPFKLKTRTYPVDMIYPSMESYVISLELSPDLQVLEVPDSYRVKNDLVEIQIDHQVTDDSLESTALIHWKKKLYHAGEYPSLREYYNKLVDKFTEAVVLQISSN